MNNEEIYEAVSQDEEVLAHYGRIGMKWYQHIYGDYQGAAKYAEKGSKKLANSKQKDNFRGGGDSEATKKLRNLVKAVKEEAKAAKKREADKAKESETKKKIADEKQQKKTIEQQAKADAKEKADHEEKIRNLASGKGDWRKASKDDLLESIERLKLEKEYKDLRDDVSGAKVWKQAGANALNDLAKKTGEITNEIIKQVAAAKAAQYGKDKDFERQKEIDKYNDERNEKDEKDASNKQKDNGKKNKENTSKEKTKENVSKDKANNQPKTPEKTDKQKADEKALINERPKSTEKMDLFKRKKKK